MKKVFIFFLWLLLVSHSSAAYCGSGGIPFSFEVTSTGAPVLGCAQPNCVAGPDDLGDESSFPLNVDGQADGFLREGDKETKRYRDSSAPKLIANCSGKYNEFSCPKKNQWVGGIEYIDHHRQPLLLQCCTFDGLKYSQDVGVTSVKKGEAVIGGEVVRDGRQISFDVIANVRKVYDLSTKDVSYEVSVRRMNCLPDPPEPRVPVDDDAPTEITRVLKKANNGLSHRIPEEFEKKDLNAEKRAFGAPALKIAVKKKQKQQQIVGENGAEREDGKESGHRSNPSGSKTGKQYRPSENTAKTNLKAHQEILQKSGKPEENSRTSGKNSKKSIDQGIMRSFALTPQKTNLIKQPERYGGELHQASQQFGQMPTLPPLQLPTQQFGQLPTIPPLQFAPFPTLPPSELQQQQFGQPTLQQTSDSQQQYGMYSSATLPPVQLHYPQPLPLIPPPEQQQRFAQLFQQMAVQPIQPIQQRTPDLSLQIPNSIPDEKVKTTETDKKEAIAPPSITSESLRPLKSIQMMPHIESLIKQSVPVGETAVTESPSIYTAQVPYQLQYYPTFPQQHSSDLIGTNGQLPNFSVNQQNNNNNYGALPGLSQFQSQQYFPPQYSAFSNLPLTQTR